MLSTVLLVQGTTMLLPSSASNPAHMMAQALTMYKSLVGTVPKTGSPIGKLEEAEHYNTTTVESKQTIPDSTRTLSTDHFNGPKFSLQSPKNSE